MASCSLAAPSAENISIWFKNVLHGCMVHFCTRSWNVRIGPFLSRSADAADSLVQACNNIVCIEGHGDTESALFTTKVQESSEFFGKQNEHELKYFALGGNHLNQLNVAIDSGVPCQYSNVSLDGRMSRQK